MAGRRRMRERGRHVAQAGRKRNSLQPANERLARSRVPRSIVTIPPNPPLSRSGRPAHGRGATSGPGNARPPPAHHPPAAPPDEALSDKPAPTAAASSPALASASQQSNGLPFIPKAERPLPPPSTTWRLPASSPSIRSLCPPTSFVSECVTASAPQARRPANHRSKRIIHRQQDLAADRSVLRQSRQIRQP